MSAGLTQSEIIRDWYDKLLAGTLPAQVAQGAIDLSKVGGVAVAVGAGASNTGTQRVVLATDSALAINQSVNITQIAGVSTQVNGGAVVNGVQRITQAVGTTASLADVAAATLAASSIILAAGLTRQAVSIFNDTDAAVLIRFGAVAVTTGSFSVKVAAGAAYEVPKGFVGCEIRAIGLTTPTTGALHVSSVI